MTASIHPTAVVDSRATIGAGVTIGPYCVVGPEVVIGDGTVLKSHVNVDGRTRIGKACTVWPFASIGTQTQDLKYQGEPTRVVIGEECIIRESVTVHPGTKAGDFLTTVGDRCFILAYAHVAHDCRIGNNVVLSNTVMLAGHCHIGDYAILGGGVGIHQFVRVGHHAFIGGMSAIEKDVIPYGMAVGNRAVLAGLNVIGLRRRGFSRDSIHELRRAYRLLFAHEGTLKERMDDVEAMHPDHVTVREILGFIRAGGDRSVLTPREVGP